MTAKKLADGLVRVRTRMPLDYAWRKSCRVGDNWMEMERRWMSLSLWKRSPLSSDPSWDYVSIGPFVFAERIRAFRLD